MTETDKYQQGNLFMKHINRFMRHVGVLFFIPGVALAQSKGKTSGTTTSTPTPVTYPDSLLTKLSGTASVAGDMSSSGIISISYKPISWEGTTPPPNIDCRFPTPSYLKAVPQNNYYSCGTSDSANLGNITKNTRYVVSGFSTSSMIDSKIPDYGYKSWKQSSADIDNSAFDVSVSPSTLDLSTLASTITPDNSYYPSTDKAVRTYTQNFSVTLTKKGFTFADKISKTIKCIENLVGSTIGQNIDFYTGLPLPVGTFSRNPSTLGGNFVVSYYQNGWQLAIAEPMPGVVRFRTPESASTAFITAPNGSKTPDGSKGWFDLGSLEDVNATYCKAW